MLSIRSQPPTRRILPNLKHPPIIDGSWGRFISCRFFQNVIFPFRPSIQRVNFMLEKEIQDGLLDCPRYGIIGELRCLPSCKWFFSKDDSKVQCKFDEEPKEQ